MKEEILIAIAEDHQLVREGLVSLLKGHPVITVLFDVSNGKELLDALKTAKPDIILLDLDMPVMSGGEALEKIKQRFPKIKIIVISATFREPIIVDYVKRGANAFLDKNCKLDKLIEAIYAVHSEGAYFDSKIARMLAEDLYQPKDAAARISFTEIELKILKLICRGFTSKMIGEQIFLNFRTVEYHRAEMMKKINTDNMATLILYAVKNNLVDVL